MNRRLWGRLLVLAAAVLAAHLWLLGGMPRALQPARPLAPWNTRSITAPAVATPLPAPAPLADVAAPRPRLRTGALGTGPAVAASAPKLATTPGSAPITGFVVPPPARFRYLVSASTQGALVQGEAELQWRHDGSAYEAQLTLSVPGLRRRTQRSTGLVTPQGLAPLRFSQQSRHEEAAHFERESGKLSFSSNRPDAVLDAGAQDRLSVILQLGAMIAADASKFPPGARITLQTATAREALPWVFVVEGIEQLQLTGGLMAALKLSREPLGPYDARLELWLAPGAAYAPVRLRLTQPNGDWVDQLWLSTDKWE